MAFPGITINRLYKKLSTSLQTWNNYNVISLHVGTNDIMTQNSGCTIIVSSILPRIVYSDFTIHKTIFINQQLQQLYRQLGI